MIRNILIVIAGLVFLTSCSTGISQEEYDAALAEKETSNSQVIDLQSQLTGSESDNESLQSQLTASESDNESLASAKTELQSELATLQERLPILSYQTHLDVERGFSINYPGTWVRASALESSEDGPWAAYTDRGQPANFLVISEELPLLMSAQAYLTVLIPNLPLHYPVGEKEFTLSGIAAIHNSYTLVDAPEVMQMVVVMVVERTAWTIAFTARSESFIEWAHTFLEITDSFLFE